MKKIVLVLAATALLTACNKKEESDKGLTLTGEVKGLTQGKLYIHKIADTSLVTLDSIIVKGDSHFSSSIDLKEPEMLYLSLDRGVTESIDNLIPFFAEPGTMNIETTLNEFYAKAKIKGSKNQELLELYNKTKAVFNDKQNKTSSLLFMAGKNANSKIYDTLKQANDKLIIRKYLNAVNFAVNNGKHEVAPYIALSEISDANIKYLDTIQKSMSAEVAKSKYGKLLTEFVAKRKEAEQTNP
ncbi:DUF4369 domain-containing protein [Flavobacterium sp. SM15]|uniref:DUF4369 domain-containing protein n=1 Tax=Flavobacterium sp. SM15 TaxID=2908005 RepID=UPI001EDBBFA1|nr:DUF4369 domain-containing protein [Flavobacterium sp. SM15]MCG2611221.1 DUF4369 domain-containing protein [Flavobacterium sp. SM15]